MAAKVTALLLAFFLVWGCGAQPKAFNPAAPLDPAKTYVVSYWEVQPPLLFDPDGRCKLKVEKLVQEFCAENPTIDLRLRWLEWVGAEETLTQALRDGNPPDIFGDWQGLACRDHVLQLAVDGWLEATELTQAGRRMVTHEGKLWAWPRWFWPTGIIAGSVDRQSIDYTTWSWRELGEMLERQQLQLVVNDWDSEFFCQALVASTGCPWGRWGGQELTELFEAFDRLRQAGLIAVGGRYLDAVAGDFLGGAPPAVMLWLQRRYKEKEMALLPLPSMGPKSYLPITGASLLQFRQVRYKGDDHCHAAAKAARHLAIGLGQDVASDLFGASPWPQDQPVTGHTQYDALLVKATETGTPSRAIDVDGRRREQGQRLQAGPLLAKFWSGELTVDELVRQLEHLQ